MSTDVDHKRANCDEQLVDIKPDVIVDEVRSPRAGTNSGKLLTVIITLPATFKWTQTMRRVVHWLKSGAPTVWVIDLDCRMVTIHRPDQLPQVLDENDELTGAAPFPDLRCRVADLFFVPER